MLKRFRRAAKIKATKTKFLGGWSFGGSLYTSDYFKLLVLTTVIRNGRKRYNSPIHDKAEEC